VELLYPDNWPEITARRLPLGGRMPGSRIFASLDKPIRVDITGEPLDEVLANLSKEHDLNIVTNWNDLKRAGVDRQASIELNLPTEISLRRALTEVMEQAGAGVAEGFTDDAQDRHTCDADQEAYTVVYDINDRGDPALRLTDARLRDSNADATAGAPLARPWAQPGTMKKRWLIRALQPLAADHRDDPSDRLAGYRATSRLRHHRGDQRAGHHPEPASQAAIGDLLGKPASMRHPDRGGSPLQTVSSNYLEEMGMDIDIILNSGNADMIMSGGPTVDPVTGAGSAARSSRWASRLRTRRP
jgi:hypothetical protein